MPGLGAASPSRGRISSSHCATNQPPACDCLACRSLLKEATDLGLQCLSFPVFIVGQYPTFLSTTFRSISPAANRRRFSRNSSCPAVTRRETDRLYAE